MGLSLRQRSHSQVQFPQDSWSPSTVSDSRLPQPGGPGPLIYIPHEQGGLVIPPGNWFRFCCLLQLTGLWWRYLTPPPHSRTGLILFCTTYIVSRQTHRKHIHCPTMGICELHRKHLFLSCCIYSALHSNGSYPIVACVFVVAGMCLPSHCPTMGLHITI
jgi:hypothetical protein